MCPEGLRSQVAGSEPGYDANIVAGAFVSRSILAVGECLATSRNVTPWPAIPSRPPGILSGPGRVRPHGDMEHERSKVNPPVPTVVAEISASGHMDSAVTPFFRSQVQPDWPESAATHDLDSHDLRTLSESPEYRPPKGGDRIGICQGVRGIFTPVSMTAGRRLGRRPHLLCLGGLSFLPLQRGRAARSSILHRRGIRQPRPLRGGRQLPHIPDM